MARPLAYNGRYRYDPLPSRGSIRLLILHPACHRYEPVRCDLVTRPLDRTTAYAALSYSWATNDGDAALSCRINVAGYAFPVTRNLFEALQRLRSSTSAQPVWVDAICINQSDVVERNSQVSRMAQIYAYASRVVAWLGEGSCLEDDTAALAILRCLRQVRHTSCDPAHFWHTPTTKRVKFCNLVRTIWDLGSSEAETQTWLQDQGIAFDRQRREQVRKELLNNSFFEEHLCAMVRILNNFAKRRYFSRRWIVQELFHPIQESIIFAWGPCTYSIKSLTSSLDVAHHFLTIIRESLPRLGFGGTHSILFKKLVECDMHVCDIYNMLEMKEPDEDGLPLYNVLHRCSSLECSDKRDILFAVCSLDPGFGLKADYRLTVGETYTQFARLLLQKNLLELLLHNLRDRRPWKGIQSQWKIPTWVPNISHGFVDREIAYAPLSAEFGTDNIIICTLYQVAYLRSCERSLYGQIILSDPPGTEGAAMTSKETPQRRKRWSIRRSHRSLQETPLLGAHYRIDGGYDPLWDAMPGDLVCSTRKNFLQYASPDRELAEVVLLRPAKFVDAFTIAKVFPGEELEYFGPGENHISCSPVEVRIV